MMQKRSLGRKLYGILLAAALLLPGKNMAGSIGEKAGVTAITATERKALYDRMQLSKIGLHSQVFEKALMGWQALQAQQALSKSSILTIVDLSQSSRRKRLYIIDVEKELVLFNTFVSHGRNSGEEFARSFSNVPESFQSSLGFYVTGKTYVGKHGLSLQLKGMEEGFNHFAQQRSIVVHGADYVSETFIKQHGRLGRSQGCPAVPVALSKPIIQLIKEGSCLFVYYPDAQYLQRSRLLQSI